MTKIFNSLLLPLAATALLAACVKEAPAPERQREMVTVTASVPEATKVAFEDAADNGLSLSWEDGDCLRIISGSESGRYDILDDFEEHKARFRGPEVTGEKYNILYPGTFETVEEAAEFDFAGQVQNGNDNKDHLRYITLLEGVDTKEDICFSDEWAAAHGGICRQSGVVKFILTLPSGLTQPRKVRLSGLDKDIVLAIKNVNLSSNHVLTAYAVTPWNDIPISSGTDLTVTVSDAQGATWSRNITVNKETAIGAGKQSVFRLTQGFEETLFAGGSGTQNDPYLISGARHLYNMHADGILEQGKKTYFLMTDDVDMSVISEPWVPLNNVNPYGCEVDFDGSGHTIDNFTCSDTDHCPGFFTVLFGDVHNVRFTNADVKKTNDNTGHPCGILGGYGGYASCPSRVWDVHVQGTVTSTAVNGVGGMFGRINAIDIESCSADVNVTSKGGGRSGLVGGIFGYDTGAVTVRNCWTSGIIRGSDKVGGIGGAFIKAESSMYNCYSIAEVNGSFQYAGILGHANLDQKANNDTNTPDNHIERCIAWNSAVQTITTDSGEHYSSGAIVGYTAQKNYLSDCFRRSDLSFTECPGNIDRGYGITDQDNASPSKPLVRQSSNTYDFAYHGKAAAAGRTLSQVAQSLGWNTTIWDFSGPVPQLTGEAIFVDNAQESGAANAPTGSNPRPGEGEIRPSAGGGWTVKSIVPGVTYYAFDGVDSYSGYVQQVFVIDFDLSSTQYKLQFVYENPSLVNSEVFSKYNAIASINCGYEMSSIVYKYDGIGKAYIPNNTITDTGVANWKNEGAFYFDGNRTAKISADGYGLSISEQRKYYMYNTSEWPNIVSSAPVLINDWSPIGETFTQRYNIGGPSESPRVHQNSTHPRTAVALTEGNHLLMVAVDGRYDASGFSIGMSAKQLTRFLVTHFNPRWALNLDGGGSTTMCVQGEGDATTHVVNYPCDNVKSKGLPHDHAGERARDTHLVIVAR